MGDDQLGENVSNTTVFSAEGAGISDTDGHAAIWTRLRNDVVQWLADHEGDQ